MLVAVLIWAYLSPMPFTWCRVFFSVREGRSLARRWALASAIALVWPLWLAQFAWWAKHRRVSVGDQIEREFRAVHP